MLQATFKKVCFNNLINYYFYVHLGAQLVHRAIDSKQTAVASVRSMITELFVAAVVHRSCHLFELTVYKVNLTIFSVLFILSVITTFILQSSEDYKAGLGVEKMKYR